MPALEEESFPRGGVVEVSKSKGKRKHKAEKELFSSGHDDESKLKKKKDRHVTLEKRVAIKKQSDREVDHLIKKGLGAINHLTIASCPVNMLILGCVKEVHDYYLDVSLPNHLTGKVPITAISTTYTSLLQRLAKGDFSVAKDLKSVKDMFRPGMVVRCKITEISKPESKKPKISLTLDPKDINGFLKSSELKNGMVLCGSVSSVEDHGYIVDLGVSGIVAFLKKKEAEEYIEDCNNGEPLYLGSYLHLMVSSDHDRVEMMSGESRTVQLTLKPREVFRAEVTKDMGIKMNTLLPGMRVSAKIHKVLDKGVRVQFLSYTGTIHRSHLTQATKKLEPGQQLTAAVLYIHPVTKVVSLTCHVHLVTPDLAPRQLFGNYSYGQVVEGSKVLKVDAKSGVYLKLDDHVVAFAHVGNVSDGEVKDLSKKFPKGSNVACRVMNFDYSDNLVLVTLKKSILDRQFLRYEDIKVTEDIEVEVKSVSKGGVGVIIANHMKGFIPGTHLADVRLKHPEKRFTPGIKINARVLTVDIEEKKIILTTKKSILNSKYLKVTAYKQARPGMVLEGVVTKVTEKGLRVLFYNGVKGFVPKGFLSTELEDLSKVFFVGQVVKVQVVKSVPEDEKLVLSMKIKEKKNKSKTEEHIAIPDDLEVGQVQEMVVCGKVEKGLFVESADPKFQAFLPKEHLSDSCTNSTLLHGVYQKGDSVGECAVLATGTRVIVTKKDCLVSAAKDGTLVKRFEDVKVGLQLPGSIRNHMDYGVFVDVAGGLIGLTPLKFLFDERVPDPTKLYPVGKSVVAKVTEVNEEKKRLLLSLRLKDCYHGDGQDGVTLLETYLKETEGIMQRYRQTGDKQTLASHIVGEVVKVTVTKVTAQGALCTLSDGTKAVATEDHIREVKCAEGKTLEAVVLYVDLVADCVEVSLNIPLVGYIKNYSESKYTKARTNQTIKSEVQLIKDDFVLISLKGHALGRLAYLPAKKHLNDVLEKRQFQVTQQNAVVIKRTCAEGVMAVLQIHDSGEKAKKREKGPGHHLMPGVVVKAKVKQVLDFQMNIVIGDVFGRVHISEVADKVKEGTNPLQKFKVDKEFHVKVIGYRELKTNKHLPITHSKVWSTLPECTLRASKLKTSGLLQSEDVHLSTFAAGSTVMAYIQSFNKNCLWVQVSPKFRGKIQRHNISDDKAVVANPMSHFKVGHAYRATVIGPGKANVIELSFVGVREKVSINQGETVQGTVTKVGELGLLVDISADCSGRVGLTDFDDVYRDKPWEKYTGGQTVKVYVKKCDNPQKCVLSLRPSRLSPKKAVKKIKDKELSLEDIETDKLVKGYVSNNANRKKIFVTLSSELGAHIKVDKLTVNKLKSAADVFFIGKVVCGKITKTILGKKNLIRLSLLESDTGLPDPVPADTENQDPAEQLTTGKVEKTKAKKRKTSESEDAKSVPSPKKAKEENKKGEKTNGVEKAVKGAEEDEDSDSDVEENIRLASPKAALKTAPRLAFSAGFSWDSEVTLPPPSGDTRTQESDSESDEEEDGAEKKKKTKTRKSRAERLAAQRDEERLLVEKEQRLLAADGAPQGAEDYDRLVLQSPNSSLVWLSYMAHHLETTEIEKARAVAERALKTISFREEQEKMNVWVAYLNLENMYGTPELLKLVFDRAVQHNDSLKVHNQLAAIYEKCDKEEAAEQLYTSMLRKFGSLKDVWINYGLFYFKHNKAESARKLMQRSLKSLEQKHHLEVLSKFAQMEYKHGEAERGRTMFENVLSSYPGRTDLWSVYIDMVIKQEEHQQIRNIFERVMGLNLSAKKMKFFFKKQLDFEQKFGNEETVAAVKQKALDYVEARASLT